MSDAATPADIGAIVNRGGSGWGDGMGGGFWIFALIVLAFMGNGNGGFFGNRGGMMPDVVTNADLCTSNNFVQLENTVGRISDNQNAIARQQDNAICNLGYTSLQQSNDIQRTIENCCCNLRQEIAAEGNATRAMYQQDKIEALQAKVANLEMDQRFCGVPRLPLSFTYGVNPANLFGGYGNCGCGNNPLF